MPRIRSVKPFYLIIIDEDSHVFNVVGPLPNDEEWNKKIVEMQKRGRNVRCFSHPGIYSRHSIITEVSQSRGYQFSERLIIEEPEDRSGEYAGMLPAYAENANRKRVVQIICRGACRSSRWAEMNADYPGKEILRKSQVNDFSAKCLKCGYIAKDPYNWCR